MRTSWTRLAVPLSLLAVAAFLAALLPAGAPPAQPGATTTAAASADVCPEGYIPLTEYLREEQRVRAATATGPDAELRRAAFDTLSRMADTGAFDGPEGCLNRKHPEGFEELMMRAASHAAPRLAPTGAWKDGAFSAAIAQREQMRSLAVPDSAAGEATPYGKGPLVTDDTRYGTSGLGLIDNMGRVDDFAYDNANGRLFAAIGNGGVWMSTNRGDSWSSLNGNLPNTTTSAIAFAPTGGNGTIVALTGDSTYGYYGYVGTGAYYTTDLGGTWKKSSGVPDGTLAFAAETHPSDPNVIYLATSRGLFRSSDAGRTFSVVPLPVGATHDGGDPCDGVTDINARPECTFANHVTDLVIQEPGGTTSVTEPFVVAAVGWRGGQYVEPGTGVTQSPSNGIYRATDAGGGGVPSFAKIGTGFTEQARIGRTELGHAIGEEQDHNFLYAIVQDAVALNNGVHSIDAPVGGEDTGADPSPSVLEGVYSSSDFGATWLQMSDENDFQAPTSGSSLFATIPLGFAPGVQAWYNLCVQPDPTRTGPGGVPSRLIVCLEEVWQNENTSQPMHGPTTFKVIGRYFSGETCAFLVSGLPACPTDRQPGQTSTTHPDQHAVTFLPSGEGGVSLFVGNDGGVYRQTVEAGGEFDNGGWGAGKNDGFNTLLPYHASAAKDGTTWFGLQDNGTAKIDPRPNPVEKTDEGEVVPDPRDGKRFLKYQTFGGDGFYVAVDPDNSDIAYSETPAAAMRVTTDGGLTWTGMAPGVDAPKFNNPFIMDPARPTHLMTAGRQVAETVFGPGTTPPPSGDDPTAQPQPSDWRYVFDLGTVAHPGDASAAATDADPANSMTAVDLERDNAYVGYCGVCDILNTDLPFENGLATNVAAEEVPGRMTGQGWHLARAEGLPNRWITSIEIDPEDAKTVYVTLGGYAREWTPEGSLGDDNTDVGSGHLFVSHDAGETFTDISSNLPDVTATWVALRGDDQLLVGTDVGAFVSDADGVQPGEDAFVPMPGLPNVPVSSLEVSPQDRDLVTVATYGRGIWQYRFDRSIDAVDYRRVAGSNRIETAVQASREQFRRGSDVAVLARQDVYADALSGAPLAFENHAPMLLTTQDSLHPSVRTELERLRTDTVYLLGGTAALSSRVEQDLQVMGIRNVVRVGGPTRFHTAALIGERLTDTSNVYVVEGADADPGRGWPDALSVAPLASVQGRPILLVTTDELPGATRDAMDEFGTESATVIGGTVAVNEDVRSAIEDEGVAVKELFGVDRYETAAKVAEVAAREHLHDARPWLATGEAFPDALAAGSAAALNGGPLLLVPSGDLGHAPASTEWLRAHSPDIDRVRILGGDKAISTTVEAQVRSAIAAGPPDEGPPPPLKGEELASFTFETGAEGWTTSTNKVTTRWQVAPPGDESGQSFQIPAYDNESTAMLVSPPISHAGGPVKLEWAQRTNSEEGFDFLTVEWSVGGELFNGAAGFSGMNESYPLFDPQEVTFDAPPGDLYIRFRFSSDQLVNQEGVYVDNVVVSN